MLGPPDEDPHLGLTGKVRGVEAADRPRTHHDDAAEGRLVGSAPRPARFRRGHPIVNCNASGSGSPPLAGVKSGPLVSCAASELAVVTRWFTSSRAARSGSWWMHAWTRSSWLRTLRDAAGLERMASRYRSLDSQSGWMSRISHAEREAR